MVLKMEPIRVFLQGMFSVVKGGKNVSITINNNPRNAMNVRYVMSELQMYLGDTDYHLLEQILELLYDTLGRHIPVEFSFQTFS